MLKPSTVGLIGIHENHLSTGRVVGQNLCSAGFQGKIFALPPIGEKIDGLPNYHDLNNLPQPLDLAVVTALPAAAGAFIAELGRLGTKAVVALKGEFDKQQDLSAQALTKAWLAGTRPPLLRLVGPHSFGVMVPGIGLNASLSHVQPLPGNLAFITPSCTVLASVLDWAASRNIGFSYLLSIGDMVDVDFGDMLDYLADDDDTEAILLHVERISRVRKFISAARAAARVKPVIVLRSGKYEDTSGSVSAEPTGADAAYDAAFLRTGLLRLHDIQELFDVAGLLTKARTVTGDRLAILANGTGVGLLAADAVLDEGGRLAALSPDSMARLEAVLPAKRSSINLIDLNLDADGSRYAKSLEVLLADQGVDAVLVIYGPSAFGSSDEVAKAVINKVRESSSKRKTLLPCWLGDRFVAASRRLFAENSIATHETPPAAVRSFMQMVRYRQTQEMLMATPPVIPSSFMPDTERAQRTVKQVLAEGREWLAGKETAEVLSAYQIALAGKLAHAEAIGSTVQSQSNELQGGACRAFICELQIGMVEDVQFGPVLFFGQGGAAEAIEDVAVALPPLNLHLALEVISRTRICRLLEGEGRRPALGVESVAFTLVKISQLVCDITEIAELRINPLVVDSAGVIALDARIKLAGSKSAVAERFAIRPYPKELEEIITLADGQRILLRPMKAEDESAYLRLFSALTPEQVRMRFLNPIKELPHALAARLTQIDYDREMALVLTGTNAGGEVDLYGSVRIIADPDNERAEFAVLLRPDMTGLGLGPLLLRRIIDYARSRGVREVFGEVLDENTTILRLCEALGFKRRPNRDDPGIVDVTLKL
ncbi:MAG: GNAT family N-acetyltransferase [Desulforhabdus sp.]|jgi:acetyltransferase|nr:GNAT family N-acetyltransferase [Desulforhabdus sp.]